MDGFILIHKGPDCTSHDVVAKIKGLTKSKTGHLGTLDPFAIGLLPIALGKATKFADYFLNKDKGYIFTIEWGVETDTLDNTGQVTNESSKLPKYEEIKEVLPSFTGDTEQIPPQFSALKVKGKKAYEYARKGQKIDLKARAIKIHALEILEHSGNKTKFILRCSKGTYVRALARDIAYKLGTYGHLCFLERDYISGFEDLNFITSAEIFNNPKEEKINKHLIDLDSLIKFSYNFYIDQKSYNKLKNGTKLSINNLPFKEEKIIKVKLDKKFVAIATYQDGLLKPKKILINN